MTAREPLQCPELLVPGEVAELFGVRTSTVSRWVRDGHLLPACTTPGGTSRFSATEIHQLLAVGWRGWWE
ncbi:excisionase family DNA binding protein [Haloactinospora alba]|uniref:Excisionase family DNA binding protein n=1 Tax=Haloactinospora alba TaxID=405555 RepID=A0A543N9N1_9ACTN|nr:helix-turn-helix domain-containing protein [Haloactinospora alba]TQN28545.1 excisionase family DNA binding protein [Haloactinospora alba]